MVGTVFQNHDGVGAAHIGVVLRLNLHIMSQRRQSVDGFLRETAFQIRLARVVRIEARRINRIRQIHVVVNDVGNHVHHRRNDLRAARGTGHHHRGAVRLEKDCRRHAGQGELAGSDGIRVAFACQSSSNR